MKKIKILTLSIILLPLTVFSQNEWLDQVDVYLHTVDRGKMVYDNFGHTAIRVHNKSTGQDLVYNWGIFDFKDPVEFSLKFYRGILIYSLGVYPYESALAYYQRDQRTVWEDKINFSREEKLTFLKRLDWNNQPENREYSYHYFFDNCSTKVRDYFDEALKGSIKQNFESSSSPRTFRDTVREGYNTNPEIYFSLDTLMNGNIDKEMNQWQEMFLPIKLREHLLNNKSDRKFFSESKLLFEFSSPAPSALNGFQILSLILLFLALGIAFMSLKEKKGVERALWALTAVFIFLIGVFGLVMLLNWIFSGHIDLHHNANMLLIWPIDLLLMWPLLLIIFKGKKLELKERTEKIWNKYIQLHLAGNLLFILLWLIGIFTQNITNTAIYIAPVFSIILLLIKKAYTKKEASMGYGIE